MELAYSAITLMPNTKEEITSFVQKVTQEIESGLIPPLEALRNIRAIQSALEQIEEVVKPLAVDEAIKYGEKSFKSLGAKFEIKEVGVKYSYDNCNDQKYFELSQSSAQIKDQIKARENFLKAIKDFEIVTNEDTGETFKIFPPAKSSTTTVTVSLL